MLQRAKEILRSILGSIHFGAAGGALLVVAALGAVAHLLYSHPPLRSVGPGELGIRANRFTAEASEWREGTVLVLPGVHALRVFSLRDQVYRPVQSSRADGPAPFQSLEGLSLGVDLSVRYALDPARLAPYTTACPGTWPPRSSSPGCRAWSTRSSPATRCARSSPASAPRSSRPSSRS